MATTTNMVITLSFHYRSPKTRAFKSRGDVAEYLEAFVNDDLEAFGFPLPVPEECSCVWQSAIAKCVWHTEHDLVRCVLFGLRRRARRVGRMLTESWAGFGCAHLYRVRRAQPGYAG